jgi:hypothetical protein
VEVDVTIDPASAGLLPAVGMGIETDGIADLVQLAFRGGAYPWVGSSV